MTEFVLGGGCFWCLDSSYMQFAGITDVVVGYAGGHTQNPDYESVCGGNTGHTEVAKVVFDESVIPADVVLDIFFTIHDPRQLNRQGNDIGTQYRSAMYYTDESQKALFQAAVERAKSHWDGPIVTEITPLDVFWVGEEYHQDFFAKNPNQGYCVAVVSPKMAKARAAHAQYLKA
ncbi:MAG: peptide-methionine (S)-S-oxide reductase MsrA [Micrococcales bacterium]